MHASSSAKLAKMPNSSSRNRCRASVSLTELLHGPNFVENLIAGSSTDFARRKDSTTFNGALLVRTAIDISSDQRRKSGSGTWAKGIVELCAHLGLIVAGESPMAHMAHDTHHSRRGRLPISGIQRCLPDGVLFRRKPVAPGPRR